MTWFRRRPDRLDELRAASPEVFPVPLALRRIERGPRRRRVSFAFGFAATAVVVVALVFLVRSLS